MARSRARVLAAATDVLRESGPAELTVEEVVKRSGVARMTVYRHWPTRDDLLLDTLRAMLSEPARGPAESVTDPLDRLTATVVAYGREFARADWATVVPALLDLAARDPRVDDIRAQFVDALVDGIRRAVTDCQAAGVIGPVDPSAAAADLLGPIVYRRYLAGQPITARVCLALVGDFVAVHRIEPGPA